MEIVVETELHQYRWERSNTSTVGPHYNEVLGTMKITLLYWVSNYIRVKKQRNIKSWDQQNYLVIRGICYIRPLYNEVPLYWGVSRGCQIMENVAKTGIAQKTIFNGFSVRMFVGNEQF